MNRRLKNGLESGAADAHCEEPGCAFRVVPTDAEEAAAQKKWRV
jgi:hypothetical protein